MAEIKRPRRLYLRYRHLAALREEWDLAGFWRSKQEAQPGAALADDVPYLTRLQAAGYTTVEDLDGADSCELEAQGFSSRESSAILATIPSE